MEYQVVYGIGNIEFAALVMKHLAQGWRLHGGVSMQVTVEEREIERKGYSERVETFHYAQAMVR